MYQYIINPQTNRKVHINGKIGRKILKNYLSLLKGSGLTFSGEGKQQGPRVIIHGLVNNTELNDLHGNREDYSEERGRFLIHFETLGIEPRWISPGNITIVADLTPEEQLEIDLAGFEDENPQDEGKKEEAKMDTNSYEYLRVNNPKALTIEWRDARLNGVLFNGPSGPTEYGDFEYFEAILKTQLGDNWSKRVLNINDTLEDVENISRLGIPGKQGTVIRLDLPGKSYAVKVTKKGVSGRRFLKQARMQEIVASFGLTGHVYAVFRGLKKLPSFMVMDLMGQRVVDIYGRKTGNLVMSPLHQQQLWHLYKTLDEKVGILHNDGNCLNLMTDTDGKLKLIDFDNSVVITSVRRKSAPRGHLKKWGSYPNLNLSAMVMNSIGACPVYSINLDLYKYYANHFFENPEHNNGTKKWMKLQSEQQRQQQRQQKRQQRPHRAPRGPN
jgi:hypothetical protein